MKTIIKIITFYGLIIFMGLGCTKDDSFIWSDYVEGYVVGSFIGRTKGDRPTPRGYCILFADNSDSTKMMDFYTFNVSNKVLKIPEKVFTDYSIDYRCGPSFFVDSLRTKYKIRFLYRYLDENNKLDFYFVCITSLPVFRLDKYKEASLKDVTRVENTKE